VSGESKKPLTPADTLDDRDLLVDWAGVLIGAFLRRRFVAWAIFVLAANR
jgi:hypothetical protein